MHMDGKLLIERPLWVYALVGLLQGMLLWLSNEYWPDTLSMRALCSGALVLVLLGGWQVHMVYGQLRAQRRWLWLLASTLLLAALTSGLVWQTGERGARGVAIALNLGLGFVLTAFVQSLGTGVGRFNYPALCQNAWNNGLAFLLAALMLGGFWLLIALWVGLFKLMGIRLFADIFYSEGFAWGGSAVVCAIALRISLERGNILDALRNVIQAMCRFLLPMTVLILLLFVATLPVLGLQPLWETRHASAILLGLVFAHLCLVNGVFQDGSQPSGYPRWLQWLVNLSSLLLPLFCALACYALWLRVVQYGLTPERVYAAVVVLIASLHAVALCWAVLRPSQGWLASLRHSNPWLALGAVLVLMLMQVGPLNPLQLSAKSQYARVLSGEIADEREALVYLRFQLGAPGRAQLQQLHDALGGLEAPRRERLAALLEELQAAKNQWQWRQDSQPVTQMLWQGEPLLQAAELEQRLARQSCADCRLWAQDLHGDGQPEVLVIRPNSERLRVYAQQGDGEWRDIGWMSMPVSGDVLLERLRAEAPVSRVAPVIQALQIGELRLEPRIER